MLNDNPMNQPKISVIIPAYNECKYIGRTVKSLLAQDYPKDRYEVIVVDNNSTDNTSEIAKELGAKVILYKDKKGVSPTRQAGSLAATGEIIAGTDSDTKVPPNWLRLIAQDLSGDDFVGVTGPARTEGTWTQRAGYVFGFEVHRLVGILFRGVYFTGMNFALKKSVFDKIGGFRVELLSGEDLDLSIRAAKHGKLLYDRRLTVTTLPRRVKEGSVATFLRYAKIFLAVKYGAKPPDFVDYR